MSCGVEIVHNWKQSFKRCKEQNTTTEDCTPAVAITQVLVDFSYLPDFMNQIATAIFLFRFKKYLWHCFFSTMSMQAAELINIQRNQQVLDKMGKAFLFWSGSIWLLWWIHISITLSLFFSFSFWNSLLKVTDFAAPQHETKSVWCSWVCLFCVLHGISKGGCCIPPPPHTPPFPVLRIRQAVCSKWL